MRFFHTSNYQKLKEDAPSATVAAKEVSTVSELKEATASDHKKSAPLREGVMASHVVNTAITKFMEIQAVASMRCVANEIMAKEPADAPKGFHPPH